MTGYAKLLVLVVGPRLHKYLPMEIQMLAQQLTTASHTPVTMRLGTMTDERFNHRMNQFDRLNNIARRPQPARTTNVSVAAAVHVDAGTELQIKPSTAQHQTDTASS